MYLFFMMVSTIFMFLSHPLSMGISITAQTMIIAVIMGTTMNSFWPPTLSLLLCSEEY